MFSSLLAGRHRWCLAALLTGACLPSTASWAQAPGGAQQQPQAQQQRQAQQRQLQQPRAEQRQAQQRQYADQTIRTGDGMLAIQARMPEEIHTGEQFTYEVTVQNTTDNISLHDIKLRHTEPSGLTIDSIEMEGAQGQRQDRQGQQQRDQQPQAQQQRDQQQQGQQTGQQQRDQQQGQQTDQQQRDQQQQGQRAGQQQRDQQQQGQQTRQQRDQQQGQRAGQQQQQREQPQQDQQQQQQREQPQQQQADQQQQQRDQQEYQQQDRQQQDRQRQQRQDDGRTLSIDQLGPGESRTFFVSATADQEGPVDACLVVTSYQPAICLQTRAVRPELHLAKMAPDQARLCDVIELTYTVTNDGTGSVGEFEIVDELADGLRTIDDQDRLAFTVDQLEAGETRQFVASVYATRTGQFTSRAQARALDTDLTSRSDNVGPEVVGADLQVNVEGQGAVPSNTPAMFTATITNTGNAPADNVDVYVRIPQGANLRRMSEVQMVRQDQQQQAGQQQRYQQRAQQQQRDQQAGQQQADQQQREQQAGQQQRDRQAGQQQRDQQAGQQRDQQADQQQQRNQQAGQQRDQQAGQLRVDGEQEQRAEQSLQQRDPQAGQQQPRDQQAGQQQQRNQQAGQRREQQAQLQQRDRQVGQQQDQRRQQLQQGEMREERFSIGRLEPGQTARFDYVVTARDLDEIQSQVEAVFICDLDVAEDIAETGASAQAMTATRIVRLPGLQVYALDDVDPVVVGNPVTYTIRVKNEGDAPDQNVRVTATLPQQLEFESAQGPTQHEQQNGQIAFEPIEQLAPGEEAEYTVTATATAEASVQLQVEVESRATTETVQVAEPTQLFEAEADAPAQAEAPN